MAENICFALLSLCGGIFCAGPSWLVLAKQLTCEDPPTLASTPKQLQSQTPSLGLIGDVLPVPNQKNDLNIRVKRMTED